jgi:pyrimidine deaminase RibD-like protein
MREALVESHAALPQCSPNPPVGCVIVHSGELVARGHTGRPGQPHAEAAALARLPFDLDRHALELFVTLEPCSFAGRTPSCALAIIASGIRRVTVATLDPDPRNSGRGIQMLRGAGIRVELGVLEDTVLRFIRPYLWGFDADQPSG